MEMKCLSASGIKTILSETKYLLAMLGNRHCISSSADCLPISLILGTKTKYVSSHHTPLRTRDLRPHQSGSSFRSASSCIHHSCIPITARLHLSSPEHKKKQECIPVGCVPAVCGRYPVAFHVPWRGSAQPPPQDAPSWMQTLHPGGRSS